VRPEIKSYADIRGKTVVVDAPNTAFALILYARSERHQERRIRSLPSRRLFIPPERHARG
jgi:hypothetical protein